MIFQFLGDASQAYSKHFKIELEGVMRGSGHRFQDLGPSVVVFHETSRTNTLDNSGNTSISSNKLEPRTRPDLKSGHFVLSKADM